MQPNYIERMNNKRATAAQSAKEQSELASMLAELKKMQMASLMGQSKPSIVLTDQTDLGQKMKEFGDKVEKAILATDPKTITEQQLNELKNVVTAIRSIPVPKYDDSRLLKAIQSLKLSTVVNVPDLPAPNVDLSSLESTMRELWERPEETVPVEKIDLDCYRAQDISESGDKQYVGFVNPDGAWYIIENDITGNKMRYVFGLEGYARAFKNASTYEYQLLNEAIASATA